MRVKRAQNKKTKTKKLFKRSKGFFGVRKNTRRQATEAVLKARSNAFTGRKQRKRQFRRLWITRINAAVKPHGISYSRFMHGLEKSGIAINRKMLSEMAIHDAQSFETLVQKSKEALG
jgi:large subunit ribosomal protein L20